MEYHASNEGQSEDVVMFSHYGQADTITKPTIIVSETVSRDTHSESESVRQVEKEKNVAVQIEKNSMDMMAISIEDGDEAVNHIAEEESNEDEEEGWEMHHWGGGYSPFCNWHNLFKCLCTCFFKPQNFI